jgi:hypothetical protein
MSPFRPEGKAAEASDDRLNIKLYRTNATEIVPRSPNVEARMTKE